jgi:hypothetical protein
VADESFDDDFYHEDFYHDDPDQEINDKPDRKKNIVIGFCASVVLIVSANFYLSTSFSGSVAINTGANKEFGVGVSARTACSGTNSLEIATSSSNSATSESPSPSPSQLDLSSTSLKLSSITVSNIPATCTQKDFIIRVYDESGNKLPLFNSTSTDAYVYMNSKSAYRAGLDSTGMKVTSISTSKFEVAFDTPVSTSINVKNITIESAPPAILFNCKDYFDCSIGDVGPGSGTVFYANATGFNCGPSHNATGSPIGGLCNFLEVAPTSFISAHKTTTAKTTTTTLYLSIFPNSISNPTTNTLTSDQIGAGYKYTNAIVAANSVPSGCTSIATCHYGPNITRLYTSNSKTDWYLPTLTENNELCKWLYNVTYTSDTQACLGAASGSIKTGFTWPSAAILMSSSGYSGNFWATSIVTTGSSCSNPDIGRITVWNISNANGNGCSGFFPLAIRAF